MSVLVLVEGPVKAEDIPKMKSYMAEILPDTLEYDGCQGVEVYFNMEDHGNMILVEYWDSRAHHENYVGWLAHRNRSYGQDRLNACWAAEHPLFR